MLRNCEAVWPPEAPSLTGHTHASITQFVAGKLHSSGSGTVLLGPWIHIPELAQPKEPQRVADVLITPAGPSGPPAPIGTITAAGFPPPPAPGTQPDENPALKFFPFPLESRNTLLASPARIHDYGVTAANAELIIRHDVNATPADRIAPLLLMMNSLLCVRVAF